MYEFKLESFSHLPHKYKMGLLIYNAVDNHRGKSEAEDSANLHQAAVRPLLTDRRRIFGLEGTFT